jgi:ABC-2 type transport system ATP-binding protein
MRLLGHDLPGGAAAALARVGAIIEEPRFHGHLTGRENLHVDAAARDAAAHGRVDAALARVGLAKRGDDRVKRYSWACASASASRAACCATPVCSCPTSR